MWVKRLIVSGLERFSPSGWLYGFENRMVLLSSDLDEKWGTGVWTKVDPRKSTIEYLQNLENSLAGIEWDLSPFNISTSAYGTILHRLASAQGEVRAIWEILEGLYNVDEILK